MIQDECSEDVNTCLCTSLLNMSTFTPTGQSVLFLLEHGPLSRSVHRFNSLRVIVHSARTDTHFLFVAVGSGSKEKQVRLKFTQLIPQR